MSAPTSKQAHVYILECSDGSFYTGWTNDIIARLRKHKAGKASKYTRARLPVTLLYMEPCDTRSAAMKRENAIKRMTRAQKEKLIHGASTKHD